MPARQGDRFVFAALQGRVLGVAAFLVLLCIGFGLASRNFASVSNANTIALNGAILVVVACAEAVVVITRNYDLSVGSVVALSSYVGLDMVRLHPDAGAVLIAVPVLIGAACGAFNGFLVATCRLPSVIATLGTMSIYRGLAYLYAGGHQIDPKDLPPWVGRLVGGHVLGISVLVLLGFGIAVAATLALHHLRIGREIYALGSNPEAAPFYGLRTQRVIFRAYLICGALTGLAGFLFGARVSYVVPYLAQGLELTALAAVVLGGHQRARRLRQRARRGARRPDYRHHRERFGAAGRHRVRPPVRLWCHHRACGHHRRDGAAPPARAAEGATAARLFEHEMKTSLRGFGWEATLVVLILLCAGGAARLSPFYLDADQILYSLQQALAVAGLLAGGLMMIVVGGEIDISLPAILAMGTILFARMAEAGLPIWLAVPVVVAVGACAGLANGLLVVTFGLPSLAVTLGTNSAYRALALALGGQEGHANFSDPYIWVGSTALFGWLPLSLLLLTVVFVVLGFVMHGTVFGRKLYMIGANPVAMRFSGTRVGAIKVAAFAGAGAIAGLAALVYVGQFESARADNAGEILLFVVAAVTLGGVDVFGGRGHVAGVFLALLLLGTLKNGMGLANLPGPVQTLIIGGVLVVSVAIPQLARLRRHLRRPASFTGTSYAGLPRPAIEQHGAREEGR